MKPSSFASLSLIFGPVLAFSQTKVPSTAYILGEVPDGNPPAPEPPMPKFILPSQDILKTQSTQQGGRTVTVQEIKPIALPPPPPPMAQPSAEVAAEFRDRLDAYRDENPRSGLLFLGATVFRFKDSLPRTLIRYWPEGGKEDITLWSSADFALIAGGINSFTDTRGESNHLLMGWDNVELDHIDDLISQKTRLYEAPAMPEFLPGKATYQIIDNLPNATATDLAPIQALHDLYNSEHARLEIAFKGREQARLAQEAHLKANPPQPKNLTLSYWRTETPTPQKGDIK